MIITSWAFSPAAKIEAEIIKPIYEILVREIGKDRAQAVIGEAIEQAAIDAGKGFASKEPNGANIKSFIALQYLWEKDNALEVKVIDADDQQYNYNVTRCRYAEMYHEMGLGEIGHLLSCARDEKIHRGLCARRRAKPAPRPLCRAARAVISATAAVRTSHDPRQRRTAVVNA